jgi:hypothetical protein
MGQPFQRAGSYTVRAHLCKMERRIHTVEATAVVTGWEGYPDHRRSEHGCPPAHRDEPIAGEPEDGPLPRRRPPPASDPCG